MSQVSHSAGANSGDRVPASCNHTAQHKSDDGQTLGSWVEIKIDSITYIACSCCGIKFGTKPKTDDDAARRAYLEQQRRLACPGCGEEPFLG